MGLLTPADNPIAVLPLRVDATSQQVAAKLAGSEHCTVALARMKAGGDSEIDRYPRAERVFYVVKGPSSLCNTE